MTADRFPTAGANERLDAVLTEYLESVERGESCEPEVWLQRYPEVATELELFFAAETRFDRMIAPLRTATVGATPVPNAAAPVVQPLKTIKDYDLLAEIGRGGMGVIYKARQRSLNRLVAIKMIRAAEWATPAERMRFRWEAEAIAALDHPNIVPIYEIGEVTSDDGTQLPFFSMKLIEGENLAQGREHFRDNWKAIARLMVIIARAVEHAHQRGILHRDLKPANILLSGADIPVRQSSEPLLDSTSFTPHISDFGLAARAQQQRGQTYVGTIVGTPSYLAPELASGQATATIASDIYALGAILYELLIGKPPFRADTPLETMRMLTTTSATAPRKDNPDIPQDLETICLKSLEPDPQQRYRSAGKLADELELFLAGRSISARPVGSLKTFRRWCRRQPVIAGLGGALLLSITVSLPLILWNWRRAVEHEHIAENRLEETRKERERADDGFELAHGAFEDLFRMIGDSRTEEFSESDATNKELLERGLKYYREFVDRRRDDPKMRRELAAAMFRIGMISARIKTNRDAVDAFDKAIDFIRSLLDQYPDDTALSELLARALSNRGNALGHLGQWDDAIRSHEAAAEIWSHVPDAGAGLTIARRQQGIAFMNRGLVLRLKGDRTKAMESFELSKNILINLDSPPRDLGPLINCYLNIAQVQDHLSHLDKALNDVREAKKLAEKMFKTLPNSEEAVLMLGQSLHMSGKIQIKTGNLSAAKTDLSAAQQHLALLHHAKPKVTKYKRSLALIYDDLATVAKQQKKPNETLQALERAELLLRELTELDAETYPDRSNLANTALRLVEEYMERKNFTAAVNSCEVSRINSRFLISRQPSNIGLRIEFARACFLMGVCLGNLNKLKEALSATDEAIENFRLVLQHNAADSGTRKNLSSSLGNSAIILRAVARPADAIAATEERMKLWPANATNLYDAAIDFARTYDSLLTKPESNPDLRSRAVKSALKALQQALAAGLPGLDGVRTDPAFTKIRETKEFQMLLKGKG